MFDKADLPAQDKEKARASLNMDNARDSMSLEESDADGGQRTYPIRFINSLSFTDTDGGSGRIKQLKFHFHVELFFVCHR